MSCQRRGFYPNAENVKAEMVGLKMVKIIYTRWIDLKGNIHVVERASNKMYVVVRYNTSGRRKINNDFVPSVSRMEAQDALNCKGYEEFGWRMV